MPPEQGRDNAAVNHGADSHENRERDLVTEGRAGGDEAQHRPFGAPYRYGQRGSRADELHRGLPQPRVDRDQVLPRSEPDQQQEIDPGADRRGEREPDLRIAIPSTAIFSATLTATATNSALTGVMVSPRARNVVEALRISTKGRRPIA